MRATTPAPTPAPAPAPAPALEIGHSFWMGRIACTITGVRGDADSPHYVFQWRDDSGAQRQGQMPCAFVDTFTGYDLVKRVTG